MADVNLRIKEICKEKGITLEALAKRLGILRTSLAQAMSRDSFSTKKLGEIADALDVPVWQLFVSADDIVASQTVKSHDGCVCPVCGAHLRLVADEAEASHEEE